MIRSFLEEHHAKKPIYAALVPDEIFKGSHFKRRFTTPSEVFGKSLLWQQQTHKVKSLSQGYSIEGFVREERLRTNSGGSQPFGAQSERNGKNPFPNWSEELKYILEGGGEKIPVSVTVDVFVEDTKKSEKLAFEINSTSK